MSMNVEHVVMAMLLTPAAVVITFLLVRAAATAWFKTRNEFNRERRD